MEYNSIGQYNNIYGLYNSILLELINIIHVYYSPEYANITEIDIFIRVLQESSPSERSETPVLFFFKLA